MGRWSKRPQPAVSAARPKIFCLHVGYRLVHLPCQFSKNQPLDSLPTAFSYYDICNCTRWALVRSKRCPRPPWATLLIALDILRIRAHRWLHWILRVCQVVARLIALIILWSPLHSWAQISCKFMIVTEDASDWNLQLVASWPCYTFGATIPNAKQHSYD